MSLNCYDLLNIEAVYSEVITHPCTVSLSHMRYNVKQIKNELLRFFHSHNFPILLFFFLYHVSVLTFVSFAYFSVFTFLILLPFSVSLQSDCSLGLSRLIFCQPVCLTCLFVRLLGLPGSVCPPASLHLAVCLSSSFFFSFYFYPVVCELTLE